jgi:hypothetical protein
MYGFSWMGRGLGRGEEGRDGIKVWMGDGMGAM